MVNSELEKLLEEDPLSMVSNRLDRVHAELEREYEPKLIQYGEVTAEFSGGMNSVILSRLLKDASKEKVEKAAYQLQVKSDALAVKTSRIAMAAL